ncbi:MAG: cache domain-containing protein [Desulfacinum sp.]|nr:cache domain-containing protein [Desulfacinum sp.]
MLKSRVLMAVVFALVVSWSPAAWSSEATPKEVVAKVSEAAQLLADKGEGAFAEISDRNGRFVWKDSYCFVLDLAGTVVAHPIKPNLVGKNLMNVKDIKGKLVVAEYVSIAKSPEGSGWSEYWWPKPGEKAPSMKVSYIMKVPGRDLLVAGGLYDLSKAEVEKMTAP